jgi:hypothetical protein
VRVERRTELARTPGGKLKLVIADPACGLGEVAPHSLNPTSRHPSKASEKPDNIARQGSLASRASPLVSSHELGEY